MAANSNAVSQNYDFLRYYALPALWRRINDDGLDKDLTMEAFIEEVEVTDMAYTKAIVIDEINMAWCQTITFFFSDPLCAIVLYWAFSGYKELINKVFICSSGCQMMKIGLDSMYPFKLFLGNLNEECLTYIFEHGDN